MAAPLGAYVMKDSVFTVEATDYANQCTSIVLTPEQATQTLKTLVPDGIVQDVDTATWTCTINGIQDMTDSQGLAALLNDMQGEQIDIVFTPKPGGKTATFTATAKAVPFGGEQGAWATVSVDLPVTGTPVFS
jgi:hypothetical protein